MILWSRLLTLTQTISNQDWAHHFNGIRQSALNSPCHLSHHWKEWGTKMWGTKTWHFPLSQETHIVYSMYLHMNPISTSLCTLLHGCCPYLLKDLNTKAVWTQVFYANPSPIARLYFKKQKQRKTNKRKHIIVLTPPINSELNFGQLVCFFH